MSNSVELISIGQVVVHEVTEQVIELIAPAAPSTVEVVTQGPAGAVTGSLNDLVDVDTTLKADGSVLYYDASTSLWKGDDINTLVTLTDGGNW